MVYTFLLKMTNVTVTSNDRPDQKSFYGKLLLTSLKINFILEHHTRSTKSREWCVFKVFKYSIVLVNQLFKRMECSDFTKLHEPRFFAGGGGGGEESNCLLISSILV